MRARNDSPSFVRTPLHGKELTLDVLLVEDSPPDAIFVKTLLRKGGGATFNLVWCEDLKAGISMMERIDFDAVLLDLGLPDSDGLDTIKSVVECARCPIIVLSGTGNEDVAVQAVQMGAQDYLMKNELNRRHLERAIRYAAERYQMLESLMESKLEVEAASRVKSEFLSIMSHEFRTPMNGIIGGLNLLKSMEVEEEVSEIHEMMNKCAHDQVQLIDNVLAASQAQGTGFELSKKSFLLHDLILSVFEMVAPLARLKPISLTKTIESNVPPVIYADEGRLRQVLVNLVENAIKYSDCGHVFLIISRNELDELTFSVSDEGVGIERDKLEEIFKAFTQIDMSYSRRSVGTGVGLAISKRLVELMGGDIQARSVVGEGSVFSFTLRFSKPNLPHAIAHPEFIEDRGEDVLLGHKFPLSVLVVDENEDSLKLIKEALSRLGYEPSWAMGATEAVDMVEADRFDFILIDLDVEGVDGENLSDTLLLKARSNPMWGAPYVVAVTSNVTTEDRKTCLDCGLRALLEKPIELDDLRGIVESAFGYAYR